MPSTQRRAQAGLIDRLIKHPFRFHFFQAVRLIELWLRRDAASHGKKLETVLRCKNSVALGFPPSQIEALAIDADTSATPTTPGGPPAPTPTMGRLRHIRLTPAFMGFLGVNGVLPYDYTATIAAQIAFDKNHAGRAFFDTFSHRMMVLFYRAWAACHIEFGADADGRDRFLEAQLALAGRPRRPQPAPTSATSTVIPAEAVAHYAALIRHRPMQSDMIAGVLTDFFRVPFRCEPLVGCWVNVGQDNCTALGVQNNALGFGILLGDRYWRRDALVRLWVGPLSHVDFDSFPADGSAGTALREMLALFALPAVAFELRPILRAADVRPAALDNRTRLGVASLVLSAPQATDHAGTRYLISF